MKITLSNIRFEDGDPKVWDLIDSGDTDFCFQIASPGMKHIIIETKPRSVIDLAEINALYRPGPMEAGYVEKYIALKTGKSPEEAKLTEEELIIYNILKKVFGPSHTGLLLFQEDVMKLCQEGADFTLAEADDIRSAMGKKKLYKLEPYKPQFIKNWKFEGDPSKIWEALIGFAKYAFNKSHSVAYATIGYKTAELWLYHPGEFLEYSLNYDTKQRYAMAMDKIKELHFKYIYPTIFNLSGTQFKVDFENRILYLPGNYEKSYDSYVSFLFDYNNNERYKLIYKGVCDNLIPDRYGLVSLLDLCNEKNCSLALYMEPGDTKFNSINEILDGLNKIGLVSEWHEEKENGNRFIKAIITRPRCQDRELILHLGNCDYNKLQNFKYDKKQFGSIRKGILSSMPYINTTAIENKITNIEKIKTKKLKEAGYIPSAVHSRVFSELRNTLNEYMKNYFSNPSRRIFEDIYVQFEECINYERSTKIFLNFEDKNDIFYIYDKDLIAKIQTLDKKSLVKITMEYSPFILKRNNSFVYDFDIKSIEPIVENE